MQEQHHLRDWETPPEQRGTCCPQREALESTAALGFPYQQSPVYLSSLLI